MTIRRIIASTTAVFERFIDQVENHEAVADSLIREVALSAATLKSQLGSLEAQAEHFRKSSQRHTAVAKRWESRAKALAERDEVRALECVRRLTAAEEQAALAQDQFEEQQNLIDQIRSDLAAVEARLSELKVRRSTLAARGARSRALADASKTICVEDSGVFNRWEAKVLSDEYLTTPVREHSMADEFEREFDEVEADEALRARLQALAGK